MQYRMKGEYMIATTFDFYKAAQAYAVRFDDLAAHTLKLHGQITPDHICYKCGTHESFERMLRLFEPEAVRDVSIISGRTIAYIELTRWVESLMGPIHYLELADQKPDGSQQEGFDHIESYPEDMRYEDLIALLEAAGQNVTEKVRPHHTTHEIKVADDFSFVCTREPLIDKINREKSVK